MKKGKEIFIWPKENFSLSPRVPLSLMRKKCKIIFYSFSFLQKIVLPINHFLYFGEKEMGAKHEQILWFANVLFFFLVFANVFVLEFQLNFKLVFFCSGGLLSYSVTMYGKCKRTRLYNKIPVIQTICFNSWCLPFTFLSFHNIITISKMWLAFAEILNYWLLFKHYVVTTINRIKRVKKGFRTITVSGIRHFRTLNVELR